MVEDCYAWVDGIDGCVTTGMRRVNMEEGRALSWRLGWIPSVQRDGKVHR